MIQQDVLSLQALPDEQRLGLLELARRIDATLSRKDAKAFAAEFAEEGSCISPAGAYARDRAGIEALIRHDMDELIRDSKGKFELVRVRPISPTLVFADFDHHLDRVTYPDGNVGPMDVHVASLVRRAGSKWELLDVRAHVYLKPPVLH